MSNVCECCGKEFDPVDKCHPNQRYCSKECRAKSYVKPKSTRQLHTDDFHERRREYARRYAAEHVEKRDEYYAKKFIRPASTGVDPLNVPLRRLNGENLCMWCGYEFVPSHANQRFCCDEHTTLFYNRLFNKGDLF